jgi:hypothetical protein
MTTEARDALAAALHEVIPMTVSTWPGVTDAILAALDGWTLVPVDTVADAEALAALPIDRYAIVIMAPWPPAPGGKSWSVGGSGFEGRGPTLAAAVRAALGASDDE